MKHSIRAMFAIWTLWLLICSVSKAQSPTLTTVQDTIYNPDGTRFNGYLVVTWKTPQGVSVAQESRNVRVVSGVISVGLIPNSTVPGSYYDVRYTSGGYVQLSERWTVTTSMTPVTIASVRGSGSGGSSGGGVTPPGLVQTQITDISGLGDELAARPVKGTGYSISRAAVIDNTGALSGATGNAGDCLHVDGSSANCSTGQAQFADAEVPSGALDGTNTVFSVASTPSPAISLQVFRNGLLLRAGVDYTLSGRTIQFLTGAVPQPNDLLGAYYRF